MFVKMEIVGAFKGGDLTKAINILTVVKPAILRIDFSATFSL